MAIEKKWVRIITYLILGLMVIGFSVPGFLDLGREQEAVQPRLCQNDAECYLLCGDLPVKVLCSQNLCQQNTCEEKSFYPFVEKPLTFTLIIEVERNETKLEGDSKNMFVDFKGNKVELHSSGLSLGHVLEKAGMYLDNKCLAVGGKKHCGGKIFLLVNGKESYSYSQYVPEEGDLAEIVYS